MARSRRKTRRCAGDGTEWQDSSTRQWRWRIRWEGQSFSVSDRDRARAAEKFNRLRESLKKDIRVHDSKQTLAAFIPYWLETAIKRDVDISTYRDYLKRCELYIIGPLGHYRLCDLTAPMIRQWLGATRDNYAFSSAKQARALLERILDLAVEDKLIEENPAALVKPPKPVRKLDTRDDEEEGGRALSVAQVVQLLAEAKRTDRVWSTARGLKQAEANAVRGNGTYLFYFLAVRLGLRRGELLGLRWKDIDLDHKLLRVRQQVRRTDTGFEISPTLKTPAARRTLPLTDEISNLIRFYQHSLGECAYELVFHDKNGGARDPQSMTRNFTRLVKRVGLGDFHLHDLRHTFVTAMRRAGVDIEVAAAMAGHEKAETTANIYSDADMGRKRTALEQANRAVT